MIPPCFALSGTDGEAAAASIRSEGLVTQVQVVPEGSMVTMDHREDRVRVFVDASGNVARPPKVG